MNDKGKKRELNFFTHAKNVMGLERFHKAIRRGQSRFHELLLANKSLVLSKSDFKKVESELEKTSTVCSKLNRALQAHKRKFNTDD